MLMKWDTALVVIDAQVNMFAEEFALLEGERLLRTLSQLLARARAADLPIIYQ